MLVELTLCACFVLSETATADKPADTQPAASNAAPQPQTSTDVAASPGSPAPQTPAAEKTAGKQPTTEAAKKGDVDDELLVIERNIIHYTNFERTKRGLPPLEVDENLMDSARAHTAWMTRRRSLVHTSSPVAENIAMGQRNSREAVADWMNSPGHRANILTRSYQRIGVAAYRATNGTIYWCQQFRR